MRYDNRGDRWCLAGKGGYDLQVVGRVLSERAGGMNSAAV